MPNELQHQPSNQFPVKEIKQTICTDLTTQQQQIVIGAKEHRIIQRKHITVATENGVQLQVHEELNAIIQVAYMQLGHTTEGKAQVIAAICNDCVDSFGQNTISDIKWAVYYGLRGEFGEFVTLNMTIVHKWIKMFNETIRRQAIHKQSQWEREQEEQKLFYKKDAPQFDSLEQEWEAAYNYLAQFIAERGHLPIGMNWGLCLCHLEKIGEINDSNEQKQEFKKHVRDELLKRAALLRKQLRFEAENDMLETANNNGILVNECRKRRITAYLQSKKLLK